MDFSRAPVSSLPPGRYWGLHLALGDAVGNHGGGAQGTHDAAAQQERDAGRQQQRENGHRHAGIFVIVDIGDGLAAADETVVGVVFDQQVEFLVDLLVQLFKLCRIAA
jgi:hypothetical protein